MAAAMAEMESIGIAREQSRCTLAYACARYAASRQYGQLAWRRTRGAAWKRSSSITAFSSAGFPSTRSRSGSPKPVWICSGCAFSAATLSPTVKTQSFTAFVARRSGSPAARRARNDGTKVRSVHAMSSAVTPGSTRRPVRYPTIDLYPTVPGRGCLSR